MSSVIGLRGAFKARMKFCDKKMVIRYKNG
jgi:hypothetical protein